MKKTNMKIILVSAFLFIFISPAVYAISSTHLNNAKIWYQKECGKNVKKIIGDKAMLCYLFDKVSEQDIKIDSLVSGKAALKTFDANDNELGIFVDNDTFFYPPLNLLVSVDITGSGNLILQPGGLGSIYYEQAGCTGQPYLGFYGVSSLTESMHTIFPESNGKYYIIDETVAPIANKTLLSSYNGPADCDDRSVNNTTVKTLKEVAFPLGNPISLPLKYRYR